MSFNDDKQGKPISTSQTHISPPRPLILGGTGRVGRMLAKLWPKDRATPLWQRRVGAGEVRADDLIWDILTKSLPGVPDPISAVIVLAGVTHGPVADLQHNTALAQAGVALAHQLGVKTLVASSQAVYGRQTGALRETDTPAPVTPYGQAKWDMEQAVGNNENITCLRIGNVAGCGGLFQAMARGPIQIDQFLDGQGPRRMMIGPRDLADVLATLSAAKSTLPKVLNVANPHLIGMDAMADAASVTWHWQPAPNTALPVLAMDVAALCNHIALPGATAADMIAQARAGGWKPAP